MFFFSLPILLKSPKVALNRLTSP